MPSLSETKFTLRASADSGGKPRCRRRRCRKEVAKMVVKAVGEGGEAAAESLARPRREAKEGAKAAEAGLIQNSSGEKTARFIVDSKGEITDTLAPKIKNAFPADPNDLTKQLGVPPTKVTTTPDGTTRMVWEPNANTRIRYESHPEGLSPGDA